MFSTRDHEPQLPYTNGNAAEFFKFVLMLQICTFAVQVEPEIFLEISQMLHHFRLVLPHFTAAVCSLPVYN